MLPPSPHSNGLPALQSGPRKPQPLEELPPITPLAAEGEDQPWWREAPAAGSGTRPRPTAFAPQRPSLLDGLLGSALGEAGPRAAATAGVQLPPPLPAVPRSAPGAPRRMGPLPPPPELAPELIATLRPVYSMPAPGLARGPSTSGAGGALADTAASAYGGGGEAAALDALEQAAAWLQAMARTQSAP